MQKSSQKQQFSGFFRRLGAILIDYHIFPLFIAILITIGVLDKEAFPLAVTISMPLYSLFSLYFFGMTVGKWMVGIRIIKEGGKKLTFLELVRRELFLKPLHILFFGMGIWYMFSNNKRQTLYDKKLGLVVVIWRKEWIFTLLTSAAIFYTFFLIYYTLTFR